MPKSRTCTAFISLLLSTASLTSLVSLTVAAQAPNYSETLEAATKLERIEVTSRVPHYQQSLSKVLPQTRVLDDTSHSSDSLAELFINAPEISLNGQGGLLQSVNIRGFSRWRIQTLVEGIPVYTERRAGTSAEFVPPAMVSDAFITAGAASTQLGSGAIGGGLDIQLAQPQKQALKFAFGDSQHYRDVQWQGKVAMAGAQQNQHSLQYAFNHRHANNSDDGNGKNRLDGFEQHSALLRFQNGSDTALSAKSLREGLLFWSGANNVNKSSADDPAQRFTLYPENTHLLGKLTFNWHNAAVYVHDSKLETLVTRPGNRTNFTRNDALDLGVQFSDQFSWGNGTVNWRAGIDGRTNVTAREVERAFIDLEGSEEGIGEEGGEEALSQTELTFDRLNLDGEQWEASMALDTEQALTHSRTNQSTLNWVGGVRVARHWLKNKLADATVNPFSDLSNNSTNQTQTSGFLGLAWQANANWKSTAYLSSAYRVPSLTELYFNGATPRGTVLGNANLKTEQARNAQLSVQYEQQNSLLELSLFHQRIDNYIERVRINDELRQYRNIGSGENGENSNGGDSADIQGISYRWQQQGSVNTIASVVDWQWQLSGQWLSGENNAGQPIQDIPPAEHRAVWRLMGDVSQAHIAVRYRQRSNEIVNGELPTPGVTTIDLGFSHQFNDTLKLNLAVTNLTDKLYVTSRDDLAPFARGRNVQLGVVWGLD